MVHFESQEVEQPQLYFQIPKLVGLMVFLEKKAANIDLAMPLYKSN